MVRLVGDPMGWASEVGDPAPADIPKAAPEALLVGEDVERTCICDGAILPCTSCKDCEKAGVGGICGC